MLMHLVTAMNPADFALLSHPGQVRPLNEDAIGADTSIGLFILADGLGGYNAGEIASTMAVSSLLAELGTTYRDALAADELFDPARVLRDALVVMNANIFRAALNSTAFEGMATTVVVAWLLDDTLWVAHTGDSRLYRYRGNRLEQLTRDHSFSQELLDAGMVTEDEARTLPAKNLVTRALGASPDIEPEVNPFDAEPGDIVLLCSDGLTEMVTHYEIDGLMSSHRDGLSVVAQRLVDHANEAGGRDNVSVVLFRVPSPPAVAATVGHGGTSTALASPTAAAPSADGIRTNDGGESTAHPPPGSLATPGSAGRIA